jgi:acyl-CoA reductase-like NAD-dependent aldehyde dehydrogenase
MAASISVETASRGAKNNAALEFLRQSPKKLLINGKWVAPKSGQTFETINPANEEVLALIGEGDKADVDEAVKAARKAFEEGKWPAMGPHQRARLMFKIAELIDAHAEELAELETLDNGKPLTFSRGFDVPAAAETFRYYAGWVTKIYGETNPSDPAFFNYTLRESVGVAGRSSRGISRY